MQSSPGSSRLWMAKDASLLLSDALRLLSMLSAAARQSRALRVSVAPSAVRAHWTLSSMQAADRCSGGTSCSTALCSMSC